MDLHAIRINDDPIKVEIDKLAQLGQLPALKEPCGAAVGGDQFFFVQLARHKTCFLVLDFDEQHLPVGFQLIQTLCQRGAAGGGDDIDNVGDALLRDFQVLAHVAQMPCRLADEVAAGFIIGFDEGRNAFLAEDNFTDALEDKALQMVAVHILVDTVCRAGIVTVAAAIGHEQALVAPGALPVAHIAVTAQTAENFAHQQIILLGGGAQGHVTALVHDVLHTLKCVLVDHAGHPAGDAYHFLNGLAQMVIAAADFAFGCGTVEDINAVVLLIAQHIIERALGKRIAEPCAVPGSVHTGQHLAVAYAVRNGAKRHPHRLGLMFVDYEFV